jgi:putative lipoprotein
VAASVALWPPAGPENRLKLLAADSIVTRAAAALASALSALLLTSSSTPAAGPRGVVEPVLGPDTTTETPVTLAGIVSCRGHVQLPHHATVKVVLADVSPGAVTNRVVAQTRFAAAGGQMPLAFALAFDAAGLGSRRDLEISASIETKGRVVYVTPTPYRIDPAAAPAAIELVLVSAT